MQYLLPCPLNLFVNQHFAITGTQEEHDFDYACSKMLLLIQRVVLASVALYALHLGASAGVGAVVLSLLSLPTTIITVATYLSGKAILAVISAVATGSFKALGVSIALLASSSLISRSYSIKRLSIGFVDRGFQYIADKCNFKFGNVVYHSIAERFD